MLEKELQEWPKESRSEISAIHRLTESYLKALNFIYHDSSRDAAFRENHMFAYIVFELTECALVMLQSATSGFLNACKREARFLVEASIKACFIQKDGFVAPIEDLLSKYRKELDSSHLSIWKKLNLPMLTDVNRENFNSDVGKLLGVSSDYVHLTTHQIQERINAVRVGNIPGKESIESIRLLREILLRAYALSLVFLFHTAPNYVAGDFFVEADGSSPDSPLMESVYMASMDSHFDYKNERQQYLAEIIAKRKAKIKNLN